MLNQILKRLHLISPETRVFHLLDQLAGFAAIATEELEQTLCCRERPEKSAKKSRALQQDAETLVSEIASLPNGFGKGGREGVHALASLFQDILESAMMSRAAILSRNEPPIEGASEQATVVRQCVAQVREAVAGLRNLDDARGILHPCGHIHSLTMQAEAMRQKSWHALIANSTSSDSLYNWRDIFDPLEAVVNCCQDAADALEAILTQNGHPTHEQRALDICLSTGEAVQENATLPAPALQDFYDCVCAALRKPLSEGGHLGLTAAMHGKHSTDIAAVLAKLTDGEAVAVFNWLDNARAGAALDELCPERARYLLEHAPPGRITSLTLQSLNKAA